MRITIERLETRRGTFYDAKVVIDGVLRSAYDLSVDEALGVVASAIFGGCSGPRFVQTVDDAKAQYEAAKRSNRRMRSDNREDLVEDLT